MTSFTRRSFMTSMIAAAGAAAVFPRMAFAAFRWSNPGGYKLGLSSGQIIARIDTYLAEFEREGIISREERNALRAKVRADREPRVVELRDGDRLEVMRGGAGLHRDVTVAFGPSADRFTRRAWAWTALTSRGEVTLLLPLVCNNVSILRGEKWCFRIPIEFRDRNGNFLSDCRKVTVKVWNPGIQVQQEVPLCDRLAIGCDDCHVDYAGVYHGINGPPAHLWTWEHCGGRDTLDLPASYVRGAYILLCPPLGGAYRGLSPGEGWWLHAPGRNLISENEHQGGLVQPITFQQLQ